MNAMNEPVPSGVLVVARSRNNKLGEASATMVSMDSCPSSCAMKSDCYATKNRQKFTTNRLNVYPHMPIELAQEEAKLIRELAAAPGAKRDLRLHVVGDCQTDTEAQVVSEAADEYQSATGKTAWTYTHGNASRESWGNVSVLKSCETLDQAKAAHAAGYAAALVVPTHNEKKATVTDDGFRLVPCPEQTKGTVCTDCRMCLNDQRLHKSKTVITFQVHSVSKERQAELESEFFLINLFRKLESA